MVFIILTCLTSLVKQEWPILTCGNQGRPRKPRSKVIQNLALYCALARNWTTILSFAGICSIRWTTSAHTSPDSRSGFAGQVYMESHNLVLPKLELKRERRRKLRAQFGKLLRQNSGQVTVGHSTSPDSRSGFAGQARIFNYQIPIFPPKENPPPEDNKCFNSQFSNI